MNLPKELEEIKEEIKAYAASYGLDFYETIFEIVDYDQMNEVASYGGFPNRYHHWRYGMHYEHHRKSYAYGLRKIYEMVINNDPCYAYLLKSNNMVDQKLVMAHVYAHCDFFKNNLWFFHTNRKMADEMANHATRIIGYTEKYGLEEVERFLDTCLSIEELIDPHWPFIKRREDKRLSAFEEQDEIVTVKKLKSKGYMDKFINPKDFIEEQKKLIDEKKKQLKREPQLPEKDVLLFLIENAPLENWQRDVLSILREESYYFAPQAQTKIMNEGWATYWHSKIMTQKAARDCEIVDYADHHSGTLAGGRGSLNPYKLGYYLFLDIEERWDKGKFGKQYDECADLAEKKNWDKRLGLGQDKIFEVRKIYNDVSFIDAFLTEEFCREHKLYTYRYNEANNIFEIADRDFKEIKKKLLFSLTNFGQPLIYVMDGNYRNRGELYLKHMHEGIDLRLDYARDTLRNICRIWNRPVHLETMVKEKQTLLSFDGQEHQMEEMEKQREAVAMAV